jgi:hypothetical protein
MNHSEEHYTYIVPRPELELMRGDDEAHCIEVAFE